jgi:hypothetical protein
MSDLFFEAQLIISCQELSDLQTFQDGFLLRDDCGK